MNTLKLETGIETFDLNGKCEVSFNPSDMDFLNRVFQAFTELEKINTDTQAKISGVEGFEEIHALATEGDKAMRPIIDGVFGVPVCDAVFETNVTARTKDGIPIWAAFLMQIIDVCDANIDGMDARASKKVKAYTDKYRKKYHK